MTILLIIMVVKDMTYSLVPLVRATPHLRIISALSLHYPRTIPASSPHLRSVHCCRTAPEPCSTYRAPPPRAPTHPPTRPRQTGELMWIHMYIVFCEFIVKLITIQSFVVFFLSRRAARVLALALSWLHRRVQLCSGGP